jgi:hypothetical protein
VTLTAIAVSSGWAYLSRPVADRYQAFSYPIVSLAELAADRPGSAVIADEFTSYDVSFLDFDRPPAILAPGTSIPNPTRYSEILGLSPDDLSRALGPELGGRAAAVAWDPSGAPTVWAVTP